MSASSLLGGTGEDGGYITMPSVSSEIISDITEHIRKLGGDFSSWCVDIARDAHNPVLEAHQAEERNDGLIYREASTAAGARTVRDYFVTQLGTVPDDTDCPQDGKLVYAYKRLASQFHSAKAA